MNLQGSSVNLQGGTGINLGNTGNSTALQVAPNVQPAGGISLGNIQSAVNQGAAGVAQNQQATDNSASSIASLLAQIKAQQAAYAPPLPSSFYSQALSNANTAVNPYYTTKLNDFITQQTADKVKQQQQTQMNIQNLQTQLQNTLQGNQISGARTAQDTLQNEQQAAQAADQQQQTQGTQFDQARIAQAKQLATQGLTTSGLGGQQVLNSQTDRNTQETQQGQAQQQALQQQELLKSRTFEDLARSGELANQSEKTGETQANFDLNNFIQQQGRDYKTQSQDIESQRLQAANAEQQRQQKLLFSNFLNSISNPLQRQAAVNAYGSLV